MLCLKYIEILYKKIFYPSPHSVTFTNFTKRLNTSTLSKVVTLQQSRVSVSNQEKRKRKEISLNTIVNKNIRMKFFRNF